MEETTCCFVGHREIKETEDLRTRLYLTLERHIVVHGVDTFLCGSKSRFDDLCVEMLSVLKKKYPHIKRVYVRAEYPEINEDYRAYLMQYYEDTYYPASLRSAGRSVYVERNGEMIRKSRYCIVYYDLANEPTTRKSGAKMALEYARKQQKVITVLP